MRVLPEEFKDVGKVLDAGASKYGEDAWLHGISWSHRSNHESMSRHLAEAYCGVTKDHDTGLHPLLHLAARALMEYTVYKRDHKIELEIDAFMKLAGILNDPKMPNDKLRQAWKDFAETVQPRNDS